MWKRIWVWIWAVVEVVNAIGTLILWFRQLPIGSLQPYQILGIGIAIFFLATLALVFGFIHWTQKNRSDDKKVTPVTNADVVKVEATQTPIKRQQELLEFYERQKENWKNNLSLHIIRVEPAIEGDVPKVTFWLEMINYLPVECKLVKVIHSSGTVSAGSFGGCILPAFPESIEEGIPLCHEKSFKLEMEVKGTRFPDFIKPLLLNRGQRLQWMLKGEWYIEIFGKTELWATQSYQITHDQLIEGFYLRGN